MQLTGKHIDKIYVFFNLQNNLISSNNMKCIYDKKSELF